MKVAIFLVFAVCVALVAGHARLSVPKAWNPNPSTSNPCGGGQEPTTAPTTWVAGSTVTLEWLVIANDGSGPVTLYLDTDVTNGKNYTAGGIALGTITVPTDNAARAAPYTLQILVPAQTCGGDRCTLQARSTTNWFSCATIKIVPAGTPVQPPPQDCRIVDGMQLCESRRGKNIAIENGVDPRIRDQNVARITFITTINNTNVIENGDDPECRAALTNWVCGNVFPACHTTSACKAYCRAVTTECTVNPIHALLFDCDNAPDDCGAMSLGVSIFVAALVALLALLAM